MAIKIKLPKSLNRTTKRASGIRATGGITGSNSVDSRISNARISSPAKLSAAEQEVFLSSERAVLTNNPEQRASYQKSQTKSLRPINERLLSSAGREIGPDEEEPSEDEIGESAILANQADGRLSALQPREEFAEETTEETGDSEDSSEDSIEAEDEAGQETAMSSKKAETNGLMKSNLGQLTETGGEAAKEIIKQQAKKKILMVLLSVLASISPYLVIVILFLMICFPIIMAYQCWEQKGTLRLVGSSLWNGFEETLTDAMTGQCIADTSATPKDDTSSAKTPAASAAATETKPAEN